MCAPCANVIEMNLFSGPNLLKIYEQFMMIGSWAFYAKRMQMHAIIGRFVCGRYVYFENMQYFPLAWYNIFSYSA